MKSSQIPSPLAQHCTNKHCLVVLNGPTGDLVPDLGVETWGCNGNFLRRRVDHVVALDHHRVQFARQHNRSVWTRPRFCRRDDIPVPDQAGVINDSGNAAIWAAAQLYQTIIIAGADSWMGGQHRTVCDELYPVAQKKSKLPAIWYRRFGEWTQAYPDHEFIFVWPEPQKDCKTMPVADIIAKYCVSAGSSNKNLNAD